MAEKKAQIQEVDITAVSPNNWNPNQMPAHLFNELGKDLAEEDLDQPVIVVVRDGKFVIVDGEHRYRSMLAAGKTKILVSVRDYSDDEAKIRTVRRNMIRGQNDPAKFTKLVQDLNQRGLNMDEIRARMAISDKEFTKVYRGQTLDKSKKASEVIESADKGAAQTFLVANLSQMIRDIVAKYGDTISQGFICFSYKGQTHLMVSMEPKLQKAVTAFVAAAQADGLTTDKIASKLADALDKVM